MTQLNSSSPTGDAIMRSSDTHLAQQATVIKKVSWVGLFVNLVLSAAKLVCGIWGASQAVVADGVHSLSDCVTDVAILFGVRYWTKPPDDCHPYGHRRIETIFTVFIGIALAATAVGLSYDAIGSFNDPRDKTPSLIAFAAAMASVVTKEILYRWTRNKGTQINSSALIANAWHHRTDALSSIPAGAAVLAAYLNPEFIILDSLGAIVVSVFIFWAAWKIVSPEIAKLSDHAASKEEIRTIREIASSVAGVLEVHAIRTRFGGIGYHVDMHVLVDGNISVFAGHEIASEVQNTLRNSKASVEDVVVHIEPCGDQK
jgi:cation diffusion facilitator family transporter